MYIKYTYRDINYFILYMTSNNSSTNQNLSGADSLNWRQLHSNNRTMAPLYIDMNKRYKTSRGPGGRGYDKKYYNNTRGYSQDDISYTNTRITDKSSVRSNGSRSVPESSSRKFPVIKTTVQNLNLECVKPQRAGVIIYTVVEGATFFGLGLDSRTHDLTDFGGGVIYKIDQNVVNGALREFEEETLQIFEEISPNDIKKCPVIYDDKNLIIFIHLAVDPDVVCSNFNARYKDVIDHNNAQRIKPEGSRKKISDPEVCGITWLSWEEFQRTIKGEGVMFSRVQRFLNRAEDFSYLL
jgi:hypothetical protein